MSGVVWGGEIVGRQHTDVMGSSGWGVCRWREWACRAQMLRGEEAAEALRARRPLHRRTRSTLPGAWVTGLGQLGSPARVAPGAAGGRN